MFDQLKTLGPDQDPDNESGSQKLLCSVNLTVLISLFFSADVTMPDNVRGGSLPGLVLVLLLTFF